MHSDIEYFPHSSVIIVVQWTVVALGHQGTWARPAPSWARLVRRAPEGRNWRSPTTPTTALASTPPPMGSHAPMAIFPSTDTLLLVRGYISCPLTWDEAWKMALRQREAPLSCRGKSFQNSTPFFYVLWWRWELRDFLHLFILFDSGFMMMGRHYPFRLPEFAGWRPLIKSGFSCGR